MTLCFKKLPINFPKEIAIKLLTTMPQTEAKIKENFEFGYSKPRLKEARKVLSPSSPTNIQRATIMTQFHFKLENLFKKLDL